MVPLRQMVRVSGIALWTTTLLVAVECHRLAVARDRRNALLDRYARRWSRGLLWLLGVRIELASPPASRTESARLVVANHRSALDIPILLAHFGGVALSHADVARWPFLGYIARRGRTIFVDRTSASSGAQAIRAMRDRLQHGDTVMVFPEGTTCDGDQLKPFRGGAFAAARGLDVELVPVGLAYPANTEFGARETFMAHARSIAARRSMVVGCCIGDRVSAEGSAGELAQRAQSEVQSLVNRARAAYQLAIN